MKEIYIGINWEQNSTAALMVDGKILGSISEERFSRIKNDERYPYQAINWLLKTLKYRKKILQQFALSQMLGLQHIF